jgi:glycosyltransferase involved in cell wall biosynthesis
MNNFERKIRGKANEILTKTARRIAKPAPVIVENIGGEKLPNGSNRALIMYITAVLPYFLKNELEKYPKINFHSSWWESIEMIKILNDHGYIVDCYHPGNVNVGDLNWDKYSLVIDATNKLPDIPLTKGQAKVYYSTGQHWLYHNMAELERIKYFKERHGIYLKPQRQLSPCFSDDHADYMTFFGNADLLSDYNCTVKKVQLNISSIPVRSFAKNIDNSRKNFLYIGGFGNIHKGLDLTIDAFAKLPDVNLYIAGMLDDDFAKWAQPLFKKFPNIHYLGQQEVCSEKFTLLADKCIGVVYPSSAEGGPGAVAQVLHHGLIPIVTKRSAVRAEGLGYVLSGETSDELISSIIDSVKKIIETPAKELSERTDQIKEFAQKFHTRKAYSESFKNLIATINK